MMYRKFRDLVKSPLAREDVEVEQVLLELSIVSGGEVKARDVCKILSLVNNNYHGAADRVECTSEFTERYSPHRKLHFQLEISSRHGYQEELSSWCLRWFQAQV